MRAPVFAAVLGALPLVSSTPTDDVGSNRGLHMNLGPERLPASRRQGFDGDYYGLQRRNGMHHMGAPLTELNEDQVLRDHGHTPLSFWQHDVGMGYAEDGVSIVSLPKSPDSEERNTYPMLMVLHVVCMVLAFFVVLPIGIALRASTHPLHLLAQCLFLVLAASGWLFSRTYAHLTPSLYRGETHSSLGYVVLFGVSLVALVDLLCVLRPLVFSSSLTKKNEASAALPQTQTLFSRRRRGGGLHSLLGLIIRRPNESSMLYERAPGEDEDEDIPLTGTTAGASYLPFSAREFEVEEEEDAKEIESGEGEGRFHTSSPVAMDMDEIDLLDRHTRNTRNTATKTSNEPPSPRASSSSTSRSPPPSILHSHSSRPHHHPGARPKSVRMSDSFSYDVRNSVHSQHSYHSEHSATSTLHEDDDVPPAMLEANTGAGQRRRVGHRAHLSLADGFDKNPHIRIRRDELDGDGDHIRRSNVPVEWDAYEEEDAFKEEYSRTGDDEVQQLARIITEEGSRTPLIVRMAGGVEWLILVLAYAEVITGTVVYSGICTNTYSNGCLAHLIKGSIFFVYGVFTFCRYLGAFSSYGWAWNRLPSPSPSSSSSQKSSSSSNHRLPLTAESVESGLIFLYGCTNTFLERTGAQTGDPYTARQIQHISIAVMFWFGGAVGLGLESRWVKGLLGRSGRRSRVAAGGKRPTRSRGGIINSSFNPFPALVIGVTGAAMAAHHQVYLYATQVHELWGFFLVGAAMLRCLTYVTLWLRETGRVRSSLDADEDANEDAFEPSRPPTEALGALFLACGGVTFMASTEEIVFASMRTGNDDIMMLLTLVISFVCIVFTWCMISLAVKGWAIDRTEAAKDATVEHFDDAPYTGESDQVMNGKNLA